MYKSIAWGITGAGPMLHESVKVVEELLRRGARVTVFVSRAGETLLAMYGLKEVLDSIVIGDYPTGVVYESSEQPGYPTTGRLYLGVYSLVVISPATLNTVSKIVNGLADSLVSTLAMNAIKTNTRIYVLPVDAFETKSTIPVAIDREKCRYCDVCTIVSKCPASAAVGHPIYKVAINPAKCTRCYLCLNACPFGAIKFNVEITVKPIPYYAKIIDRLRRIKNLTIISTPHTVLELLGGTPRS